MVREPNSDRRERSDRELFDRIAASYAKKDLVPSSRIARRAILKRAVLPLLSDGSRIGTVVDIGCGPGGQALHLAGDFDRYIGIDQSEAMIEAARALTHDLPEATFVHANVKSEDLPVGVADLVLLVGALHHMTDIGEVIESLKRLAKPGADFVAIEPHRGNPIIQAMRWLRVRNDREYSGDQHFFIKPELEQILADGGLTDVELRYQSFLTQPFAQVILPPQWLTAPLSRFAAAAEPFCEAVIPGRLSWLLVAYGKFPLDGG